MFQTGWIENSPEEKDNAAFSITDQIDERPVGSKVRGKSKSADTGEHDAGNGLPEDIKAARAFGDHPCGFSVELVAIFLGPSGVVFLMIAHGFLRRRITLIPRIGGI